MISGEDCMNLLKKMSRDEILEVLSGGFCEQCEILLEKRVRNLTKNASSLNSSVTSLNSSMKSLNLSENSLPLTGSYHQQERTPWSSIRVPVHSSPASVNRKQRVTYHSGSDTWLNDGLSKLSLMADNGMSEEDKERKSFSEVGRKKDFVHIERINGKATNILQGLELHTRVFNAEEQKKIVELVYKLQHMGKRGHLRERTYSEPRKWMRGKGRVTIQFGCCYNYAVDKKGNPPGIIRGEEVDPLPPLFKQMIKRMVRWHILPPTCIPNSCIVNIYDEGDCIPPHIDHHDFVRPFCTVSFLTESNILFGSNLKVLDAGEFSGPFSIPLPLGSVLILNGNGADIAKHCVPAVSGRRISITFRKMDDSKLPYKFLPDPELQGIEPLDFSPLNKSPTLQKQDQKPSANSQVQQNQHHNGKLNRGVSVTVEERKKLNLNDDFPPLGGQSSVKSQIKQKQDLKLTENFS